MNRLLREFVFLACLAVSGMLFHGCANDDVAPVQNIGQANRDSILAFLDSNQLLDSTEEHSSGIFYQRQVATTGELVEAGDVLSIYYDASALGEQIFARVSREAGDDSVRLQQGTNTVYPVGLDVGLGLMREGEVFTFYLPSAQAYLGLQDLSSIIPLNSVIVIQVEVASIQSEEDIHSLEIAAIDQVITRDSLNNLTLNPVDSFQVTNAGLYYKRTDQGLTDSTFSDGQLAAVNYTGYRIENYPSGPSLHTASPLTFGFNTGSLFPGLDQGLGLMEIEEEAILIIPSRLAYGPSVFVIPSESRQYLVDQDIIPQYAARVASYQTLVFQVELINAPPP